MRSFAMTRLAVTGIALSFALSTAAVMAAPTSALAQADVTVRTTTTAPVVKKKVIVRKPVVHERVVVRPGAPAVVVARPGCRMVTTRVREGGRLIVKKVRRCP
jgi:hypothetical protein